MELGLRGKRAVVAGASRGLGLGVARALAAEGCELAVCARGQEALKQAAEAIEQECGVKVVWRVVDLARRGAGQEFGQWAEAELGGVDIVVTNSGGPPPGRFEELDEQAWREAVEGLLLGAQGIVRAVMGGMKQRGWGRVINLTSITVKQPLPGLIISNALRAAVVGWAKTLADELGPYGITVNNICQGWFMTERVRKLLEARAKAAGTNPEQEAQKVLSQIPVGRMGEPAELGALVAFLASPLAGYINGASIVIDGGLCRAMS